MNKESIRVLKELEEFIVPLSKEEFKQLKENILLEGCKEAVSVWEREDDLVLIDGHNRHKICQQNGIDYKISKFSFSSIEEVKAWMINHQLGRRNLNPDQMSYYRGLKYLSVRKKKGGYANILSKGQIEPSTSKILAEQYKVSESTIKRDSRFAKAIDLIGMTNNMLKNQILSGEIKIKKSDLYTLLKVKGIEDWVIINESDLRHKIKVSQEDTLQKIENKLDELDNNEKGDIEFVKGVDPLFLPKNDRLKLIKGRIISAINIAIDKKDINAIQELKTLIEKLETEILTDVD
ncbi:hypothetical protein [Aquimarina sp. AU58]|uniref:hypothetical protein n=1 Tax=Aquimarina sp. AU58 TaxID=1874112 RepID=UPI000D6465E6|nr:hypothetical protein [Aquimarina sp. AU58]